MGYKVTNQKAFINEEKNVVMKATHINNKKEPSLGGEDPEGSLKPDPIVLEYVDVRIASFVALIKFKLVMSLT